MAYRIAFISDYSVHISHIMIQAAASAKTALYAAAHFHYSFTDPPARDEIIKSCAATKNIINGMATNNEPAAKLVN